MKIVQNDNCLFVDCDDTLVMWDNKYKNEDESNTLPFMCHGMIYNLVPNNQNIEYLKKHRQLNRGTIVVWSAGGWEWAKTVVETLGLESYVDAIMSKPVSYLDDLDCKEFMGTRVYKEHK